MKRFMFIAATAALLFVGCSSPSPPDALDEKADIPYTTTVIEDIPVNTSYSSNEDIDIPQNYRQMSEKVYAVIENGTITNYMMPIYKDGKYSFVECDKSGKETITSTNTTTEQITTTETTTTTAELTAPPVTDPPATSPQVVEVPVNPPVTNPPKPVEPQTPPATNSPAPPVTSQPTEPPTSPPPAAAFSYSLINGLNGLPENVKNTFQLYIDEADVGVPVTKTKKNNDEIYALVYVFEGSPLTIRSVTKDGVITYKLGDSGRKTTCYVVKITGVQAVSFSKG